MQAVAEEHGCELPDDVIVSHGGAVGDAGTSPAPARSRAGEPVVVDIWPRDKASRCWSDMTRTFVAGGGEPPEELAEFWRLTKDSLERVYADLGAGRQRARAVRALVRALHRGGPADAADQGAR